MIIYHSTEFKKLRSIIDHGVLIPTRIRAEDNSLLAKLEFSGVWLSKNLYPGNSVFGQYSFGFSFDDIMDDFVVPLGEINGTNTFLSAHTKFVQHVASESDVAIAPNNILTAENRANIIYEHHIPLSIASQLEICTSWTDRAGNKRDTSDGDIYISKGKIFALIMGYDNTCIDNFLNKSLEEYAKSFLYSIVGYNESLIRRRKALEGKKDPNAIFEAIDRLISDCVFDARNAAAHIGDIKEIADIICCLINKRFNIAMSVNDIMSEYV